MFERLSTEALQHYWWLLISIIGALFLFLSFVQGGQSKLIFADEAKKDLITNALGRKWELGFTTLVLFGGAIFAAFPLLYAVSFGGGYGLWMAILFSFVIQAVAYEYRKKPNNFFGRRTYELFLFLNGTLGTFLLGVAIGTFFSGMAFVLDEYNRMRYMVPSRGLEALVVPFNVALGLTLLFLARINADLFFIYLIDDEELRRWARRALGVDLAVFVVTFLVMVWLLAGLEGYVSVGGQVRIEPGHFAKKLFEPWRIGLFGAGAALFGTGAALGLLGRRYAFWVAAAGIIAIGVGLLSLVGFGGTALLPSTADPASTLTLERAAGSRTTLVTMGYVSLMVPFVVAYIAYVWRVMDRGGLGPDEVKNDKMSY